MTSDAATVLVVEDDTEAARLYASWLGEYDVQVAEDGAAALELLSPAVDVVLLDRRMPGVAGETVLERINAGAFDCRVAVVSAVEPDFDVVATGFDSYLHKPVTSGELRSCVDRLLRRSAYSRDLQRYYALAEQRASLEGAKSSRELDTHPVYCDVVDELADLEARLDCYVEGFDHDDVRVALRDAVETVNAD
jgi:DNA-binding response OmpR family regulator